MKKKILTIVLSLLVALACAVALVACGDKGNGGHEHKYVNYVCSICGGYSHDAPVTQGLQCEEVMDDSGELIGYSVVGIGEAAVDDIFIPEVHEGKPIVSIGPDAFCECDKLTSIEIPKSVTSIEKYAFYWCSGLTIYCEAASAPSGWDINWNSTDCPVVWDYKNQ